MVSLIFVIHETKSQVKPNLRTNPTQEAYYRIEAGESGEKQWKTKQERCTEYYGCICGGCGVVLEGEDILYL